MRVKIDQPGDDIESGNVHHPPRLAGRDVWSDGDNPVAGHRDIHPPIDSVCGIDHVPSA